VVWVLAQFDPDAAQTARRPRRTRRRETGRGRSQLPRFTKRSDHTGVLLQHLLDQRGRCGWATSPICTGRTTGIALIDVAPSGPSQPAPPTSPAEGPHRSGGRRRRSPSSNRLRQLRAIDQQQRRFSYARSPSHPVCRRPAGDPVADKSGTDAFLKDCKLHLSRQLQNPMAGAS
jgi:hypothetical protein